MHDYENGHDCPRCGTNTICTIEDGYCENNGDCDRCRSERIYRQVEREMDNEY
jgi:hypothetical protein